MTSQLIVFVFGALVALASAEFNLYSPLQLGYYRNNCSNAEDIIKRVVRDHVWRDPTLAAGLLRMHFHDAFVRGADGSVTLKSPNKDAERDAIPNLSLRGFEVIDDAKQQVEQACPRVVSCADIIALAARDAVEAIKGISWPVPTGRRDGRESHLNETTDLPPPFAKFPQLLAMFRKKNLSKLDLVALSGAHTIGRAHCPAFSSRIYSSNGTAVTDPTLDAAYANKLRRLCAPNDVTTSVEMDPNSSLKFDNHYYVAVKNHQGLLTSDAALLDDSEAADLVNKAAAFPFLFNIQFARSMVKMGKIGVLTGSQGEIRRTCSAVN